MTSHPWPGVALVLTCMTLASCNDTTTEPDKTGSLSPSVPSFAVAPNSWIKRADMPTDRWALATAVVPNAAGQSILYAVGGNNGTGGSLGKVQAYNVATNTWTTKAQLPVPSYWTNGIGVIRGKLYISGGFSSNNIRAVLYMYDPATNTWTRKRDMPNTTFRGVTGVINDKLYVLTGCDQENCEFIEPLAFYRYDPATDLWTTLPKPASRHEWGMGAVINGKFYVTGTTAQLDVYDPATNQWSTRAPMPRPRWKAAGVHLGGRLWVIGGNQRNPDGTVTTVRTTSVYDPGTNTWSTRAPLPTPGYDLAASRVVFNGQPRIELVGGARPGNNLQYIP
jgi:N-acetylneuraminic acid mutarotase